MLPTSKRGLRSLKLVAKYKKKIKINAADSSKCSLVSQKNPRPKLFLQLLSPTTSYPWPNKRWIVSSETIHRMYLNGCKDSKKNWSKSLEGSGIKLWDSPLNFQICSKVWWNRILLDTAEGLLGIDFRSSKLIYLKCSRHTLEMRIIPFARCVVFSGSSLEKLIKSIRDQRKISMVFMINWLWSKDFKREHHNFRNNIKVLNWWRRRMKMMKMTTTHKTQTA